MFKKKTFILSVSLAVSLILCSAVGVLAKSGEGQIDLSGKSLSEIEAMFPMSAEEEAAIVHTIPQVSIVIDDVLYEPEEISLFDGQRLRFVVDSDGVLNAYTTVEGIERFIAEESDQLASQDASTMGIESTSYARFYWDWHYEGSVLGLSVGAIGSLGYWNDKISSVRVDSGLWIAFMYEHINFGGDVLYCVGGSSYYELGPYGWNDRISSISIYQ